jgi:KaiC/GvpD/RAD55 family RecA-like ATPase
MSDPVVEEKLKWENFLEFPEVFFRNQEPAQYIINGIIWEGESVSFVAPAGHGKSLLALEWAIKVSRGEDLMGYPTPKNFKVMYLDQENPENEIIDRIESMGYGYEDDFSNLFISPFGDWGFIDTQEGSDKIMQSALRTEARLVVIDTLGKFLMGSENDADVINLAYNLTIRRLRKAGIAVLILDHTGRTDNNRTPNAARSRGSQAKTDNVDNEFIMTTKLPDFTTQAVEGVIECLKGRNHVQVGQKLTFTRHFRMPTWHEFTETGDDMKNRDQVHLAVERIDALPVDVKRTKLPVMEALKGRGMGMRPTTVLKALEVIKTRETHTESDDSTTPRIEILVPEAGNQSLVPNQREPVGNQPVK